MNLKKAKTVAGMFLFLVFLSNSVYSQGWCSPNRFNKVQNSFCFNQIQGLTDEQKSKITDLQNQHFEEMEELRSEMQTTPDVIKRSEIRTKMLKKADAHRKAVKNLLTPAQQEQINFTQNRGVCRQFQPQTAQNRNNRFSKRNGWQNSRGCGNPQFANCRRFGQQRGNFRRGNRCFATGVQKQTNN